MKERCYNCGSDKHLALQCPYIKTGPAPKEEVMENPKRTICKECRSAAFEEDGVVWCPDCSNRKADILDLCRARFERAYMAALSGVCTDIDLSAAEHVRFASADALETVRQWDAMMAELDGEANP